ncbi:hypothetical protein FAM19024_002413 [Propionibacterium freudenreichii]|uniref:hypothetical protein n=1 Tax=Propionibacterium freudenreichii TaxID=1744 RepID=UPI0024344579|nr:hypothetical protein [Propionibacterium freudenreichii]WFF32864.1 hypothetical protein FAM19024_002413 [Propionibacterium freudenreichii]
MSHISTNLDELIAAERAKVNAKIAKLKRQAESEQRKVDAKVVELLQAQSADLYTRFAKEAKVVLDAEKAKRSAKAKRAAEKPAAEPVSAAADTSEHNEEVRQPWNG